ncbi:MAG: alpha/beta fold hydrolase, partial [Stackebrandtia sp.]
MTVFDNEPSMVAVGDGDIHVEQDGPRAAPALVLIHGSASSARSWKALVPLLADTHRVVRV